ncbi:MAG TPA: DUF4062 domain-containing protein [Longimicrobium sp.]|nr:DUF4062 domain-containing protein [Longimicrobium sp.]
MKRSVFISSTYADLAQYRRAVWTVLEQFDLTVLGMETFGARKEAPLETCIAEVEQADVYVGIIAYRLGFVYPDTGKSFTQMEYERARELGKHIFIYMMDDTNARISPRDMDRGPDAEKLEAFKSVLKDRHTVEFFTSEEDLAAKLKRDFARAELSLRENETDEPDEFAAAAVLLRQFSLAPKSVAGQQLRVKLRGNGSPYSASKQVCTAFNLEYGNTVGLPIEILAPSGFTDTGLAELYATGNRVPELIRLAEHNELDLYVTPMFSPEVVTEIRARFKPEHSTYVTMNVPVIGRSLFDDRVRHEYHKAEGHIALLFTGERAS